MRLDQPPVPALRGRDLSSLGKGTRSPLPSTKSPSNWLPDRLPCNRPRQAVANPRSWPFCRGLLHPDTGQVHALGQDLWAMSDRDRERAFACGM